MKLIPAKAVIVRHIRYTYACRDCEKNNTVVPVIKAPVPEPVIKGSFASPEAVAHIITQKFVMATPLYRQEQEWSRQGIVLSRQTMSNWLIRCAQDWLEPIYNKVWKGCLHADGYAGYHSLEKHGNITIIGCLAHARRKFDEALKAMPEKAREGSAAFTGKRYIDRLFEIERNIKNLTFEDKHTERLKRAKPVLEAFFVWLNSDEYTKGALGKAVSYTLDQWKYLERYLLDGRLEISNNRAERSIKPFVIGRKNFLFANTPKGAKASAIIYSIVETAKECGVDPFAYLTYVFKTAPNGNFHDIPLLLDSLMPWNLRKLSLSHPR